MAYLAPIPGDEAGMTVPVVRAEQVFRKFGAGQVLRLELGAVLVAAQEGVAIPQPAFDGRRGLE
eukprot:scaffold43930_cov27-Tisochrysis_lutea.AAC.1